MTFVLPTLLVAILSASIVYDGESNWLEGLALLGVIYPLLGGRVGCSPYRDHLFDEYLKLKAQMILLV